MIVELYLSSAETIHYLGYRHYWKSDIEAITPNAKLTSVGISRSRSNATPPTVRLIQNIPTAIHVNGIENF